MLTLFGKYEAILFLMHFSTLYLSLCSQANHRVEFLIQFSQFGVALSISEDIGYKEYASLLPKIGLL
jgi:hypothetical protein